MLFATEVKVTTFSKFFFKRKTFKVSTVVCVWGGGVFTSFIPAPFEKLKSKYSEVQQLELRDKEKEKEERKKQ